MKLSEKLVRVFNSCETIAQFEIAKNFAILAAFRDKEMEVNRDVLEAFYNARFRVRNKVQLIPPKGP